CWAQAVSILPVEPAYRLLAQPAQSRWLVEDLWGEGAVGIVGGEPKCCKSFLALDLAVAIASGRPALRRFSVREPGRVLLYAAEDAQHIVRARLEGICHAAGCELEALDVQVITAETLRLDLERDRKLLEQTVAALQPRLLILDPFVRLHRIDENSSGEVAPLLAYLRELQRQHALSVLLVHHARKSSGNTRAGQALRGSSAGHLTLSIEHRAAASPPVLALELQQHGAALALGVLKRPDETVAIPLSVDERITAALEAAGRPVPLGELRLLCRVRHATLHERLHALTTTGRLLHDAAGYRLAPLSAVASSPSSS